MLWLKGKTLHILYFLDAQDTRKVSLSLNILKLVVILFVVGVISGGYGIFSSIQAYQTIESQKESIKKLKATILAQTIQGENLLSKKSLQSQNIYLSPDVTFLAQELLVSPRIKVSTTSHLAASNQTVEMKKLNIGRPLSQGSSEKDATATSDASSGGKSDAASPQSETPKSPAPQKKVELPEFKDWSLQIKDLKLSQSQKGTRIKFQLINTDPNRRVEGWICAQLHLTEGKEGPSVPKFISTIKTGHPSLESCKRGQKASFRNLRYVTLNLDASKENIESLSVYFLDADSQKIALHQATRNAQ